MNKKCRKQKKKKRHETDYGYVILFFHSSTRYMAYGWETSIVPELYVHVEREYGNLVTVEMLNCGTTGNDYDDGDDDEH